MIQQIVHCLSTNLHIAANAQHRTAFQRRFIEIHSSLFKLTYCIVYTLQWTAFPFKMTFTRSVFVWRVKMRCKQIYYKFHSTEFVVIFSKLFSRNSFSQCSWPKMIMSLMFNGHFCHCDFNWQMALFAVSIILACEQHQNTTPISWI